TTTGAFRSGPLGSGDVFVSKIRVGFPPAVVSVTPSSGAGASQTFSFVYSDADGYADLTGAAVLINAGLSARNACYFSFNRAAKVLGLARDVETDWDTMVLGSSGTLQNSQCILDGGASSVSASGNNLTLNLALTFKPAFAGAKNIYTYAADTAGTISHSGWLQVGSWTAGGSQFAPTVTSVSPNSGGGASRTFSFVYSDADGYADLTGAAVLINAGLSARNACYFSFNRAAKVLGLARDVETDWDTMVLGSSGTLQNSQCILDGGASSVSASGSNLTLSVLLTFKPVFAGAKNIYTYAADTGPFYTGWYRVGSWIVP
ncbi:MAG: hypothetical protein AAB403_22680, partial [Planctomycetota bacterium]